MKTRVLNRILFSAAFVLSLAAFSCTKEKVTTPQTQALASQSSDDALVPGETAVDSVNPGNYTVTTYIEMGVDTTSEFAGYVFKFKDDGTLLATVDGHKFEGRWILSTDETKMAIQINGTDALKDLTSDNWSVAKLTDKRINLRQKGPTKVNFTMR